MARPLMYETPEELQKAVEEYFRFNDRVTLTGLALHLGFESRQSLYNYGQRDEFLDIIKNARMRVEAKYEEITIYEPKPTGAIFALKNMGWNEGRDKGGDMENYIKMLANALQPLPEAKKGD